MDENGKATILRTDTKLSVRELLTYYHNMFNDKLVANLIDLRHYERIKEVQPDFKTQNSMGQIVTIDNLVESHRRGIVYARDNVKHIAEMLASENLDFDALVTNEAISYEAPIKSPLQAKGGEIAEAENTDETKE